MGLFDGIDKASGSYNGVYFVPRTVVVDGQTKFAEATYRVKIKEAKMIKTRKGVDACTINCEILESDVPERPAGTEASQYIGFDKDAALGNVADFLRQALAALGYAQDEPIDPKDVELDPEISNWALGEEGPLVGVELMLHATNRPTKAGNDFTRISWYLPPELKTQEAASA